MRIILVAIFIANLSGCANLKFSIGESDEYTMQKRSDACAAGIPSVTLEFLRQEAVKFCATRKEFVKETGSDEVVGIPIFRCAEATLKFKCQHQ